MKKTNHRELFTTWLHIRKYGYTGVILICVFSKDTERHREKKNSFCLLGVELEIGKEGFYFSFIQFITETIGHMCVGLIFYYEIFIYWFLEQKLCEIYNNN